MHLTTAAANRWRGPFPVQAAQLVVVGFAALFAATGVLVAATGWTLEDMDAYWEAALRLRAGQPLYPAYADSNAADVYRYAPWFAVLWVPLTFLPKAAIQVAWSVVLLAASAACLLPLLRRPTAASLGVAGILGSFLITIAAVGNVQPLLVAGLLAGLERRGGPIAVAAAASLKAVPVLFLLVYAGRGEWVRAGIGLALTVALVAPMLLFDLSHYPTEPGDLSFSLFRHSPVLWAAVTTGLTAVATWLAFRRSRYAWLAMAVAVLAALPRTYGYDLTFLLVGLAAWHRRDAA